MGAFKERGVPNLLAAGLWGALSRGQRTHAPQWETGKFGHFVLWIAGVVVDSGDFLDFCTETEEATMRSSEIFPGFWILRRVQVKD